MAIDYKSAGVDIEAGYEAVKRIKQHAKSTFNDRVLGDLGKAFRVCIRLRIWA